MKVNVQEAKLCKSCCLPDLFLFFTFSNCRCLSTLRSLSRGRPCLRTHSNRWSFQHGVSFLAVFDSIVSKFETCNYLILCIKRLWAFTLKIWGGDCGLSSLEKRGWTTEVWPGNIERTTPSCMTQNETPNPWRNRNGRIHLPSVCPVVVLSGNGFSCSLMRCWTPCTVCLSMLARTITVCRSTLRPTSTLITSSTLSSLVASLPWYVHRLLMW